MPLDAPVSESWTLPWSEVGFVAAAAESMAMGPDRLSAGQDGAITLYDPVERSLITLVGGQIVARRPTGAIDDLFTTPAGLLLTVDHSGRTLRSPSARRPLPPLAPSHGQLDLVGDQVLLRDLFGNGHPIATLAPDGALSAPRSPGLVPPVCELVWSPPQLQACGVTLRLPKAIKASGQLLEGGGQRWLIVEAVTQPGGLGPISVERWAQNLDSGVVADLPTEGRLYAPSDDLAVDGAAALVWMSPQPDGLRITRVSP